MKRVEKNKAEMKKKTEEAVTKIVEKLNVPTRKELNDLKASLSNWSEIQQKVSPVFIFCQDQNRLTPS